MSKERVKEFRKSWTWLWQLCLILYCIVLVIAVIGLIIVTCKAQIKDSGSAIEVAVIEDASETILDEKQNESEDQNGSFKVWEDYRSTVLPIFVTVVITLLGCLITTYIFLKGALDRIIDQKPFAIDIVEGYRLETIKKLQVLFVISMIYTGTMAILYFALWGRMNIFQWIGHIIWISESVVIVILSGCFLNQCVRSESNLTEQAIDEERASRADIQNMVKGEWKTLLKLLFHYQKDVRTKIPDNKEGTAQYLMEWLEMDKKDKKDKSNENSSEAKFDCISFIYHFSTLEEWLILLSDMFMEHKDVAALDSRLLRALNHGQRFSQKISKRVIEPDLKSNGRSLTLLKRFKEIENILENIKAEKLFEIYHKLSKYRNILRFIYETDESKLPKSVVAEEIEPVLQAYLLLQEKNYLVYLKLIPKVVANQPMEKIQDANLYNCRVEDSSFRGTIFSYTMLSRVKAVNTNFDMAIFQDVSFFNADIRNCALSNCVFENVEMENASFENVDFNNSWFKKSSFKSASFCYARFSNNCLEEVSLSETDFSNSRMWDVEFDYLSNNQIINCIFDGTDIKRWKIRPRLDEEEHRFRLEQLRETGISEEKNQTQFCNSLYEICMEIDQKWKELEGKRFPRSELRKIYEKTHDCLKSYFYFDLEKKNAPGREVWEKLSKLNRIKFENSTFLTAKMQESCFYLISFRQGVFRKAQLERAQWIFLDMQGCLMNNANLKESCLIGVNLHQSDLENVILYKSKLSMVNVTDASLIQMQASESDLNGCYFNRSDCSNVDLTKAKVKYCSFDDGIMHQDELTESVFEHVSMKMMVGIDWLSSYSEFRNCIFYGAMLKSANFNYTTFIDCIFDFATLEEIAATETTFRRCSFYQTNFRNSCMIRTKFEYCYKIQSECFEGAKLIDCKFSKDMRNVECMLENDGRVAVINDN